MNKILLYEQNTFFKKSLLGIIKSRFPDVVTKSVLSREECLAEISTFRPDILFMGFKSNTGTVLALMEDIRKRQPSISIILFIDYYIDEYRKEAILKGASHIISRELWTGNEILALIDTILASKESLKHILAKGSSIEKNILEQPLERRRKDPKGRVAEKDFLVNHPDRRENTK